MPNESKYILICQIYNNVLNLENEYVVVEVHEGTVHVFTSLHGLCKSVMVLSSVSNAFVQNSYSTLSNCFTILQIWAQSQLPCGGYFRDS